MQFLTLHVESSAESFLGHGLDFFRSSHNLIEKGLYVLNDYSVVTTSMLSFAEYRIAITLDENTSPSHSRSVLRRFTSSLNRKMLQRYTRKRMFWPGMGI